MTQDRRQRTATARSGRAPAPARARIRPVRQAADAHDPVRDDRRSADLRAVDRQLPPELAQRPAGRRPHRGAGARRGAERHGAGHSGAADSRQRRRARGGDEDGHAAPPARGLRHAAGGASRDRHARRAVVPRHRRRVRHAVVATTTTSIRVVGPAPMGGDFLEIVLDEAPLRQAMLRFSTNILLLSLLISGITAMLVYFTLHYLLVRPMRRVTANMMAFRARPGKSGARDRARRAAATRSALPSASSPRCSATSPRCCSRRAGSRRSGSRCRRSTTTCATCSPPRSCSPKGSRICPTRACSASRPS